MKLIVTIISLLALLCLGVNATEAVIGTWVSKSLYKEKIEIERVVALFPDNTWQNVSIIHLKEKKCILESGTWEIQDSELTFTTLRSNLDFNPKEKKAYAFALLGSERMILGDETYLLVDPKPQDILKPKGAIQSE